MITLHFKGQLPHPHRVNRRTFVHIYAHKIKTAFTDIFVLGKLGETPSPQVGHMKQALCKNSKNRAFIDPHRSSKFTIRAAEKICSHCPLLKECAAQALQGGNVLDQRYAGPADGVFQAGIICHGDEGTAIRLAEIAGITHLPVSVEPKRRQPDSVCVSFGSRMVKWTRQAVPEGYVRHHARGYCSNCRAEYRAAIAGTRKRVTKPIDRNRRHEVNRRAHEGVATVQLALFSGADLRRLT